MRPEPIDRAVKAVGGNVSALARLIGVKPQAISQWTRVPAERVLEVERVTGISRHVLRPDIFGSDTTPPAEPAPRMGEAEAA